MATYALGVIAHGCVEPLDILCSNMDVALFLVIPNTKVEVDAFSRLASPHRLLHALLNVYIIWQRIAMRAGVAFGEL